MTERLRTALDHVDAYLSLRDVVPHEHAARSAKSRDPKEPGRKRKEKAEEKLAAVVSRHFRRQRAALAKAFETLPPQKAAKAASDYDAYLEDEAFSSELYRVVLEMAKDGITLFSETATATIDYSLTNIEAAKWARTYGFDLVKEIDKTTVAALQDAIQAFVKTPGFTIGDVMGLLPFDEARAERVAVSEVTRAYSQGQLLAGEQMKEEYPDVLVVKTWRTDRDDLVCPVCAPLEDEEVEIGESFSSGDDGPPAHVNCRCWIDVRTRINNDAS